MCCFVGGPGVATSASFGSGAAATVTERLVVIPREHKCPLFNGRTGIGIAELVEEVQACV